MKNVFLERLKNFPGFSMILSFLTWRKPPFSRFKIEKIAFSRFSKVSRYFQVSGDHILTDLDLANES